MSKLSLSAAFVVIGSVLVACSGSDASSDGAPTASDDESLSVTANEVLTDDELEGGQTITGDDVQAFLATKNSYLATYETGGKRAADVIVDAAQAHQINPVYLLARIQGESSLIQSGSSRGLSTATGCACPDGHGCARASAGFSGQVQCTASLTRAYLDELDQNGETRAGIKVGKATRTLDPSSVTPKNRATAALYTYTPWVGKNSSGCGSSRSNGATLLRNILTHYEAQF